ncbi:RNA polymerase factor sigma-54 [Lichenicoccus roseus]|uniref:RNA polymerase sigma-54 factor n=1 Tax=Lichenicoccus roseus TaxID=2683649 RepID=A0A5R9JA94_9PROT|nr:RNA polymerase factor sigma-54 [Lichenicoccus roseus]TLU72286.1 RNA polymerase factor sigma-54 [Lichenicoccus roseus]
MALGPRLELRHTQTLVMTPQLRQAIKLLQFSNLEVAAFVEEELERNPLLERDERGDTMPELAALDQRPLRDTAAEPMATDLLVGSDTLPDAGATPLDADHAEQFDVSGYDAVGGIDTGPGSGGSGQAMGEDWGPKGGGGLDGEAGASFIDSLADTPRSLRDHLGEQLRLGLEDPVDRLIGAHLIALLEPAGRVSIDDAALARALGVATGRVAAVRARMMRFDPVGLFARDLRECLAAQLAELNRLDPCMEILLDNLELLGRREMKRLQALCGVDAEDLADMVAEIRALDPKPGAGHDTAPPQPILPDVLMRPGLNGDWILELNPDTMPRLLVSEAFHAKVSLNAAREDRLFLSERLASANWLVKSLQQRAQTILKVAGEVMRRQDGFLLRGVGHLRPLILRDIAEAVEMHESTVSRVTANKYISTPRGLFELKYFFTTAIAGVTGESHSAEAVRHRIRGMIAAEDAISVLSDDAIVAALRREGVDIARRTVAKYREALRIPSSVQRKREKAISA